MADPVSIALLYPELLGTYGDRGNAAVLSSRLAWRGIASDVVEVWAHSTVPTAADLYLLGGGEDGPEALAARELGASRALHTAVERGAVVLAVCAGFQVLGEEFAGADGRAQLGLGLLGARTTRDSGPRRVGEVVAEADPALALPALTGYENHQNVTALDSSTRPLARVVVGHGNDAGQGGEGAMRDRVVGTYLHGPVLARNPALADLLLSWVVGPLSPVDDVEVAALREERLRLAPRRRTGRGHWLWRGRGRR